MITDKLIKEYDKEIIKWRFLEANTSFLAVVLISKEKGVSVKPYFNKKERKRYIQLTLKNNIFATAKDIEKKIDHPNFCFAYIPQDHKVNTIRKILTAGNMNDIILFGNNPVCPFV